MKAKDRMRDYRARLREQGLKPVQIWVPNQRADGFLETLEEQVQSLDSGEEQRALDFITRVGDWMEE